MRMRGFTLVELVTVLIIIAALSAVAAPRFFDNNAFNERGYADELAASLRLAGRMAAASRCPVRISVNAAGYSTRMRTGCSAGNWNTVVRRGDGEDLAGSAPAGVAVAPATTLIFNIDGTVSANAALNVGVYTINVESTTVDIAVQP